MREREEAYKRGWIDMHVKREREVRKGRKGEVRDSPPSLAHRPHRRREEEHATHRSLEENERIERGISSRDREGEMSEKKKRKKKITC